MRKGKTQLATLSKSFDAIRADWDMSRETRFNRRRVGLPSQGGSADYHDRMESLFYNDIEKARDVDRNDGIIGQAIDRVVYNTVQDGMVLDPKTGDKGLDTEIKDRWKEYAEDPERCDVQGEYTFHDFETKAFRSMMVDGDHGILGCDDCRLQPIEAHSIRCITNRSRDVVLGVELDEDRRRQKFHIAVDSIDPNSIKTTSVSVPLKNDDGVRQFFHIYNPKRMLSTRGKTALAPIFIPAGMRDDIDFAMLVQRQVAACFAIFRERSFNPLNPAGDQGGQGYGKTTTEQNPDGSVSVIENLTPGLDVTGAVGEKLTGYTPDIAGGGYEFQLETTLKILGANLGLPLCLVLLDGSETNYSGWRGAVDEARKGFRANQRALIGRFHKPVYHFWLYHQLINDRDLRMWARRPEIKIGNHKWNAPTWTYIEPVADAQGDVVRLGNSLISPRRLFAERGYEWSEVSREIVDDYAEAITYAKMRAIAINTAYPDGQPVHWRDLISIPMPNGVQMAVNDAGQSAMNAANTVEGKVAGSGEMSQLGRRQWTNNTKAVLEIIDRFMQREITESQARVFLQSIGLSMDNIDELLLDASDGELTATLP